MSPKLTLRLSTYQIVERAVEEGIAHGLLRAQKYASKPIPIPTLELLREHLHHEILLALDEVVRF